jgi:hybrid cluster-associated redox disulfide protein
MNNNENPISKNMLIKEIIEKYPETFDIFMDHGIGCIGCIAANFETLEEGISMHGIDVDKFVNLLNEKVKAEKDKK